jgi:hypothetical protein
MTFPPRARHAVMALLAAMTSAVPLHAAAPPPTGRFFARGSLGYTTQNLSELNDHLTRDVGAGAKTVEGAPLGGLEAGYRVMEKLSAAVGIDYQRSSAENSTTSGVLTRRLNLNLSLLDLSARVAWWTPVAGLHVGAHGGMGFASALQSERIRDSSDPTFVYDAHGDWSGNAFSGGVFAEYQRDFDKGLFLSARAGYRRLKIGTVDGSETATGGSTVKGPYPDPVQPVDFDFSGVYGTLGLGVAFGAP